MEEIKRSPALRIMIVASFLLMIAINALAMLLPINGQTTAEISDKYENLFAPAGVTFGIWSVIYTLLAAFVVYHLIFFSKNRDADTHRLMVRVSVLFILSSILNSVWIFTWHYELFPASVIVIAAILLCLSLISIFLRKKKFTLAENIFLRLPFSIYFGWITVATIANVTAYLVSLDWSGFGISEEIWTVAILIVGALIAFVTVLFAGDPFYGLTVVWAYLGIVLKHMDPDGHDRQFMAIVLVACVCIAVLLLEAVLIAIFGKLPGKAPKQDKTPEESTEASPNTAEPPSETSN